MARAYAPTTEKQSESTPTAVPFTAATTRIDMGASLAGSPLYDSPATSGRRRPRTMPISMIKPWNEHR